jgi:hypothetical protein
MIGSPALEASINGQRSRNRSAVARVAANVVQASYRSLRPTPSIPFSKSYRSECRSITIGDLHASIVFSICWDCTSIRLMRKGGRNGRQLGFDAEKLADFSTPDTIR